MRLIIVLWFILCSCAKSHVRSEENESSISPIEKDGSHIIESNGGYEVDSARTVEDDVSSVSDEFVSTEDMLIGAAGSGDDDEEPSFHEGEAKKPILFSVDPQRGCTNKDMVMTINGSRLHHEAILTITYPYSEAVATYSPDTNTVDENGMALYGWNDSIEMWFRTHPLVWDGMSGFVSGHYLVMVTNPDGQGSNAVGLNLQYCE